MTVIEPIRISSDCSLCWSSRVVSVCRAASENTPCGRRGRKRRMSSQSPLPRISSHTDIFSQSEQPVTEQGATGPVGAFASGRFSVASHRPSPLWISPEAM